MSKEDVLDLPPVPKKRKAIADALDVHIARWLDSDSLTPSDRKKLEEEKRKRKEKAKLEQFRISVIAGEEGFTPSQLSTLEEVLSNLHFTEIHHGGVSSKAHNLLREHGPVVRHGATRNQMEEQRAAIRDSDLVLAFPKEFTVQPYSSSGVWSLIGYASHRRVPVRVVMPDGTEL